MWTYNMSDELYHHGIKGQKWGVRRDSNISSRKTNYKKAKKEYKQSVKEFKQKAPKVLGIFRDTYGAEKETSKMEKALGKMKKEEYNYELAKSKSTGRYSLKVLRYVGEKEYNRLYDKYLKTMDDPDEIHEKALVGKEHVLQMIQENKIILDYE